MKSIKKLLLTICYLATASLPIATNGLTIEVPPADFQDINTPGSQKIQSRKETIIDLIQAINFYLRFSIGIVAMAVLIYGGFILMTSQGDEGKVSNANNILVTSGIGIGIAVFSYVAVRVIVNLF